MDAQNQERYPKGWGIGWSPYSLLTSHSPASGLARCLPPAAFRPVLASAYSRKPSVCFPATERWKPVPRAAQAGGWAQCPQRAPLPVLAQTTPTLQTPWVCVSCAPCTGHPSPNAPPGQPPPALLCGPEPTRLMEHPLCFGRDRVLASDLQGLEPEAVCHGLVASPSVPQFPHL